jgi:hypothetical protein
VNYTISLRAKQAHPQGEQILAFAKPKPEKIKFFIILNFLII